MCLYVDTQAFAKLKRRFKNGKVTLYKVVMPVLSVVTESSCDCDLRSPYHNFYNKWNHKSWL
jgi:hypothetical protein